MKNVLLLMMIFTATTAAAETIKVYSTWNQWAELTATFDTNPSLGRAWVNIEVDESPSDPDWDPTDHRVKVDGLYYNNEIDAVVYANENGVETICAQTRTRGRGIFRRTNLVSTKSCKFKTSYEVRSVDDGYHVRKRKYKVLSLVINN